MASYYMRHLDFYYELYDFISGHYLMEEMGKLNEKAYSEDEFVRALKKRLPNGWDYIDTAVMAAHK